MKTYPLLQSQLGVFLQCMQHPDIMQYNLPSIVRLDVEKVDLDRLEAAVMSLYGQRRELHISFLIDENGDPGQYVNDDMKFSIVRRKMSEDEFRKYAYEGGFVRPFRILDGECLFRCEIIETDENAYLLSDIHHLVGDGMTFTPIITMNDLPAAYDGKKLEEIPYGMLEAAEDEAAYIGSEAYQRDKEFYAEKLAGLDFASFSNSGADEIGKMIRESSFIGIETVDEWCRNNDIAVNLLFQAAFSYVISVVLREETVAYYSVNHGRMDRRLRKAYGMFVHSVPMVSSFHRGMTVREYIRSFRGELMSSIRHGAYPFNHLCQDLGMTPGISFNFCAIPDMEEALMLDGVKYYAVQPDRGNVSDDLGVLIFFDGGNYEIRSESSEAINSRETMRTIVNAIKVCIANMMAAPDADITSVGILDDASRAELLSLSRGETMPYDAEATFPSMFLRRASETPDAVAVSDGRESYTYSELEALSGALATHLRKLGVGTKRRKSPFVGVMLGSGRNFMVATIGTERAGGAYVPLDYEYPAERLQYMLADSGSGVLITSRGIYEAKVSEGAVFDVPEVIFIEEFLSTVKASRGGRPVNYAAPDGLAYMIYTSGSTGRPKGVMIPHRAKSHFIQFIVNEWHLTASSRISCHSSVSFDASVEDLYPVLTAGGTLYIVPQDIRKDMDGLHDFIVSNGITGGCYTTQFGQMLLQQYPDLPVEYLVVGGEKMTVAPSCKCRLINTYGPTEFTVDSTFFEVAPGREYRNIPIGRPLHNLSAYVVDRYGNLMPRGVAGELCMAGPQIASGYWGREDLTAEKFVDCPFGEGKMYHTGDLVRYNAEGQIEYLGRIDGQVKLRGFRIELGEIETLIAGYEGMKAVSVQVREVGGVEHLCAYYTADCRIEEEALKGYLSSQLTEYMVPTAYTQLDAMPLTPNGKVNVKALPDPVVLSGTEYVAPEGATEIAIADAFASVLRIEGKVGALDSFFSYGGDSIKSIKLVSLLRKSGITVSVADVMQAKTVRGIAALAAGGKAIEISQDSISGNVVNTPILQYFFDMQMPVPGHYNQSVFLKGRERIDVERFKSALNAVCFHHDMLRAVVRDSGLYVRSVNEGPFFELSEYDLTSLTGKQAYARVKKSGNEIEASMNPGEGPLFKVGLFHLKDYDSLLLVIHHAVVDGVSWRILVEDISTAYAQLFSGSPVSLPAKTHSFQYAAEAFRRYGQSYRLSMEKSYWDETRRQMFATRTSQGRDYSRKFGSSEFTIDAGVTSKILSAPSVGSVEMNDILLCALGRSLRALTGEEQNSVLLEGHGREEINEPLVIDRTVGWFTATYPVILQTSGSDAAYDLRLVKQALHSVPNKGVGYGLLYGCDTDVQPLATFNYLGSVDAPADDLSILLPDETMPPLDNVAFANKAETELTFDCMVLSSGKFRMRISYNSGNFTSAQIECLSDSFRSELESLADLILSGENLTVPADLGETTWSVAEYDEVAADFASRDEAIERIFPLNSMQQGMLLKNIMEPESLAYKDVMALRLGVLPTEAQLRNVLDKMTGKHDTLRIAVVFHGVSEYRQVVVKGRGIGLSMVDISKVEDKEKAVRELRQEMMRDTFELQTRPLYHVTCAKTGENECYLLLADHHIVNDGWSLPYFFSDFFGFLNMELNPSTAVTIPTESVSGRFEAGIREILRKDKNEAMAYWTEYLSGYETPAVIASLGVVSEQERAADNCLKKDIPNEDGAALVKLCREAQVTPNTVVELAWGTLLHRYNRTDDVVFGKIVSGRDNTETDVNDVIGLFINAVPVRIRTSGSQTVSDALSAIQAADSAGGRYDFCSLSDIQALTSLGNKLYQSTLVFENYPTEDGNSLVSGMPFSVEKYITQSENFDELSVTVYVNDEGRMALEIKFDRALYRAEDVQRLLDAFIYLVHQIVSAPQAAISSLSLLDSANRGSVEALRCTARADVPFKLYYEPIEANAVKYPERTALIAKDRTLTFREFNVEANRVAHALIRRGVKRGDRVVLLLPRTSASLVCMFGVSKTGAAYIPCDPEYPADRINLIMTDSEARFVITTADHASDYPSDKIILSEEIYNSGKTEKGDDENPGLDVSPEDLAYLIYTSGSTGRPKGVMLRHVGITNYLYDHPANVHIHGLIESGVKSFVSITTLSFDMSLKEFAGSLFNGITVILADEQEVKDAHMLASLMKRTGAEAINGTCSRILTYLELDEFREAVSHCKAVWAGGEQYPEQLLKALQGLGVRIFNTYGPTEITVSSNIAELTSASRVSVGRPLLNYEEFIVDRFDHPVPVGCTGELLVGGPGVALGYNNLPEMTAQRFVEYEGIRVYRTGDLARWRPDGEVEIIGRNDGQVKLRGFRVELGEVEGVAVKHPEIRQAVADIKEVGAMQHLCLYYTSDSDLSDDAVSAFMAQSLTEYMVPTIYMRLESIPLTPNGKVNRKALPKPEIKIGEIVLPGNETEQKVADLLKEMLKVDELGVTTNLISLGFSSIAAMRLSAALLQKCKIRIPVQEMIAHPTVREMVQSVIVESGRTEYKAYPKRQHYPLSESQRGMLVDCLMNPDALQYNILYLLKYKTLDTERFRDALKAVADAHPYIKARIALSGGNYVQVRNDEEPLEIEDEVLDFEPDRAFFQSRVRPFRILEDRLYRFNIFKTPTSYYLLIDIHHLISDGSSNYVLAREIERAYNGEKLEAEEYTAFDRAIDEESIMKSPRAAEAEKYFDGLLSGVSATSYPASSEVEAGATYCEIFEDISAAPVDEFCKSHSVAPSSFFFTVLHNVLHRLTREDNTLIYFISNGRSEVQLENFFGVFVKTLPTVVSHFDIPLEESVKALHSQMMDTIAHDYYPFTRISARYGLKVEILYDYFVDLQTNLSLRGDAMNVSGLDLDTAKMPLSFTIIRNEAGDYRLSLEYDARLYGKADMKMLSAAFRTFALNCVEPSVSKLSQVELLTECERNEIIALSRGADMDVDVKETFVSLFVKQAAATPDAVAVVGEDGTYTYRELDLRSNALANYLIGNGVKPGGFVCIEMFASSAFAVSMIAVQKAGAAYVPVDPSYPDDRRNFMKEDSGAAAVITVSTFDDVDWSADFSVNKARPGNPAYMIYTSGSTGRPKGVMVPHRGLLNFIHFTIKEWGLTAKSRISVHASVSFDASVEDLFPVLVAGGSLYPVPQDVRRDLALMHDFLVKNGITGGNYSTQFGMMLVQTYPDLPLEYLNVGGEKMTSNPDCKYRLINTYGPTEFTDNSTYFILEHGKQYRNIPIGRPLHNLSAYVLDKYGHLLPQGVSGELCMAGPQIALGYWHRDDLTAEKFIDCPFREGKMYRTGDLARYNADGMLEYMGRMDNQVKLRGFRIELGEIESLIAAYEGIRIVSVQVREIGGVQHLCAYYSADTAIDADALRDYLAQSLTDYMVPTSYMQLDEMPMTPNGKVNVRALPEPQVKVEEIVAPETETEKTIFDIVVELLRHSQFGVTTNLVSMGLSSLSAMKLSAMLHEKTGFPVPVTELMNRPVIRDIASFIDGLDSSAGTGERTVLKYYPLSGTQRGIFVDWDMHRDTTQYNIVDVRTVDGCTADALKEALEKTVDAHPYIKTRMAMVDGDVKQERRDDAAPVVSVTELAVEPSSEFFQNLVRPFDLFNDDLYRIMVFKTPSRVVLFTDFHHIVFDGGSCIVFMNTLDAVLKGNAAECETYTAFDVALDEAAIRESERYSDAERHFDEMLAGAETTVYPHSQIPDGKAVGNVRHNFCCASVSGYCKAHAITESNYFLAMTMLALHRLTGEEQVVATSINSGRNDYRVMQIVGMFVKTLPVCLNIPADGGGKMAVSDIVGQISSQFNSTVANSIFPFTEMTARYGIRPEILFAYQPAGEYEETAAGDGQVELDTVKTPVSIDLLAYEGGRYCVNIEYDGKLYSADDMECLAEAISIMSCEEASRCNTVAGIPIITDASRAELLSLSRGESMAYDAEATFPSMFLRRASETPDAVAVSDGRESYTYSELEVLSGALAAHLRKLGVGTKRRKSPFVGVMLGSERNFMVATIGTERAGGAYVPLDYEYPAERLQYMLSDSGSGVLITSRGIYGAKLSEGAVFDVPEVIFIEEFLSTAEIRRGRKPVNYASPDGLAYMIYTSGSTGRPKGVMIPHRAKSHFIQFIVNEWHLTASSRISCHSSVSFDASVEDLYPVLAAGGTLFIVPGEVRKDLALMHDFILKNGITGGNYSTQFGMLLLQQYPDIPVEYFNVGGEKMQTNLPCRGRLINTYGPTEFTVDCTYYELEPGREYRNIPIGRPLHNLSAYVVDRYGNLMPRGLAGELCMAGPQIASGYWGREDLTAEKFVDCPFGEGKMYHTGDLVRYNAEGQIEYLGRIDGQVKLRGFRIELGEIETLIAGYEGMKAVSVQVREVGGVEHLCAYYTADCRIEEEALKGYLSSQLTEYMVPTAYTQLDAMPLTPNGKVNVKALPDPEVKVEEIILPSPGTEEQLYAVAIELLKHNQFGVTTNLISVGLTSLSAMRLSAMLNQTLGRTVSTGDIMAHPTLREIASIIDGSAASSVQIAEVHGRQEFYPLTENQRGVYADWEMNRDALQYNIPEVNEIKGYTAEELRAALIKVVEAHPYMKARLVMRDGDVFQMRRDEAPVSISCTTLDAEPDQAFFQSRVRPFDLFEDDLYRLEIYSAPSKLYLFADVHHLIYDGASGIVFMRDLNEALEGGIPSPETYTAFDRALDEAEMMRSGARDAAEAYFDGIFSSYEVASYPSSSVPDSKVPGLRKATDYVAGTSIMDFCRRNGFTPSSFFLAVTSQVLHSILREDKLMFTSISNGRMTVEMQDIVGMFVQTLPVVTSVAGGNVSDTVRAVQDQYIRTQENSLFPYTSIVRKYGARAEIMVVYQGSDGIGMNGDAFGVDGVLPLDLDTVKMPLMVSIYPDGDEFAIELEYDASKYSAADMHRLASAIGCMADSAAHNPSAAFRDIPLLTSSRIEEIEALGKGDFAAADDSLTLVDLLRRQAAATPDSTAVVFRDRKLTYRELDALTDNIAVYLHSIGVEPEKAVGVMIERSELLAVYPIAIMKAGGAYMPLDSHFPEDRLSFMCEDAGVDLILSDGGIVGKAMPSFNGKVVTYNDIEGLPEAEPSAVAALPKTGPDNMFVILYTSGSTGKPKGCVLEHHNIVNFCHWYVQEFDVTASDRSMAYANFGFDAHMMDMYPALSVGASVYVIPSEMRMDMVALNDYMNENGISITFLTTQIGYMFATTMDNKSLRLMSVGGEKLLPLAKPGYRFYNGYGPTECTLFSTFYNIESDYASSLIGRPLSGYALRVVDRDMRLVPQGAQGELVVMGAGVGRGYLNRPDINAEKFITVDGMKAYRTGDLVRWSDEGFIEYLGRIDGQVKLRGLRIELGEVESRISQYPGIVRACVAVKEVRGTQHLCCYYVTDAEDIDIAGLKGFLGERLTEFMIPSAYMRMDSIPLTPNGKVDRKALPEPEISNEAEYVEPVGETEIKIASCFGKVLGIDGRIGALDSFYSLGGDSIKAIRLVSLLRQDGIVLQVAQVMRLKTVRALSEAASGNVAAVEISQEAWSGEVPQSAITEYFFGLHLPDENHFLQSETVISTVPLDMDALRRTFDLLVLHHDMLRAIVVGNRLSVRPADAPDLYRIMEYDLSGSKGRDVERLIGKYGTEMRESFDIRNEGMMRVGVYHLGDRDVLDIAVHHLVVDGVSWRIIEEDIRTAYPEYARGGNPELPSKTHSYADYASALGRFTESYEGLREISSWLDTNMTLETLPHSKSDDFGRSFSSLRCTLDKETTGRLVHGAADAYHAEINDLLITAVGRAYCRISGDSNLSLQMEGHGREQFDRNLVIDRTVGWFTSIYPVILRGLGGDLRHDIRCVKEVLHTLPGKGFGYGPLFGIDINVAPLIGFNYLGEMDAESSVSEASIFAPCDFRVGDDIAQRDTFGTSILLNGQVTGGMLAFDITYDNALFGAEFAKGFADAYEDELRSIVKHCESVTEPEFTASDLGETGWTDAQFQTVWKSFAERGESILRIYPLTPMQQSILLAYISNPDTEAYRIQEAVRLNVAPDEAQMKEVLSKVAARYEVLRTSVIIHDVEIYRQAIVDRPIGVKYLDYSSMAPEERESAFIAEMENDRRCRFDIQHDPLFHVIVAGTGDGNCLLCLSFHHIIVDGWCMGLITDSLTKALEEVMGMAPEVVYEPISGKYEQYVRSLGLRNHSRSLQYWHNLLAGYNTKAVIPFDADMTPEESGGSYEEYLDVDSSVMAAINSLCRSEGITPNTVVELAWGALLQIYNNTDDVVFVKVVSGRSGGDMDVTDVVGLFINSVPVRCSVTGDTSIVEALRTMHRQAAETNLHDYCSLAEIQAESGAGSELFQSIIGFQNFPEGGDGAGSAIRMESFGGAEVNVNEMSMQVWLNDDRMRLNIRFDNTKYRVSTIRRLLRMMSSIIGGIAAAPDARFDSIPLLDEAEISNVLDASYGGVARYPRRETYVDMFLKCASAFPDAVAVVDSKGKLTYGELDSLSDSLAHRLISEGVKPDDFVCVMLGRRKEFVLSVMAIHKAGAAYVPVDSEYPEERRQYMIDDSGAAVTIDDAFMDPFLASAECRRKTGPVNLARPDGLAYMIYTSGTTGKPKGVMIFHRSIRSCASWLIPAFGLKHGKKNLHHPSFSFDASTFDLFYPLAAGAEIHVLDETLRKDMDGIFKYVCDSGITGMTMSTALGMELLNSYDMPLEYIMLGGEKFLPVKKTDAKLFNGYGPTEFTCCSSYHIIDQDKDEDIPIGKAVPGSWSVICSADGRVLPSGVPGELCLAGTQIAGGYWHRDDLTADKFREITLAGKKMTLYHTGDLARYNNDGELIYMGRIDQQVKLRGFRIELGEIENQAKRFGTLLQVVADVRGTDSNRFIALYYTSSAEIDENALRSHLEGCLAGYMVPDAYVRLESIPYTPNGKVNRKALPEPVFVSTLKMEKPATKKEQELFGIVSSLLGHSDFGVTDDLKHLGMTSLTAIKVVARANACGIVIKLNDLLKTKTIRGLLSLRQSICSWASGPEDGKPVVVLVQGETNYDSLKPYIDALSEHFSVLVIESIRSHYEYLFLDADIDEVTEMYYTNLDMRLSLAGLQVAAFTGHCLGGDLAYRLACRWREDNPDCHAPVCLLDSFWVDNDRPVQKVDAGRIPEELVRFYENQTDIIDNQMNMYTSLGFRGAPVPYDGKLSMFRAMKTTHLLAAVAAATGITEEEAVARFGVDDDFLMKAWQPQRAIDNEKIWRSYRPDIECFHVDSDHMGILGSEYVGEYVEWLTDNIGENNK